MYVCTYVVYVCNFIMRDLFITAWPGAVYMPACGGSVFLWIGT